MLNRIFNRSWILEKSLDAAWLRNEAIAQNIANVDTPGYKRKTVAFEEYLNEAMDNSRIKGFRTDSRHFPIGRKDIGDVRMKVKEDNQTLSYRIDGNNVDIENEMASMAKNTIQYNTLIQSLNDEFKRLKNVINEGRK